jgi:ABC-type uncharacterized transport system permease subunit
MDWSEKTFFAIAVAIYGVSSVYSILLFRKGFNRDNRFNYLLLLGAFAFHTIALVKRGVSLERCPINNLYEATSFITWTIVTVYLVIAAWPHVRFLGAFAAPFLFCTGVFALMPTLDPPFTGSPRFVGGAASLHATLILIAYGAFGLSSLAAVMYLCQEHDLKHRKMRAVLSLLPPIERLESIVTRCVLAGFILLTAGLAIGAFWVTPLSGAVFWQDPKVLWSGFVWFLYLTLLILHWRFAQRGRRFAWGAVGGFTFVILTFWGFNLLSGIHNP